MEKKPEPMLTITVCKTEGNTFAAENSFKGNRVDLFAAALVGIFNLEQSIREKTPEMADGFAAMLGYALISATETLPVQEMKEEKGGNTE